MDGRWRIACGIGECADDGGVFAAVVLVSVGGAPDP